MSIPIQRQYNSPNCTFSLHGFSDDSSNLSNGVPIMTVLTEAKCQILGNPTVLSGGLLLWLICFAQLVLMDRSC
nr:DUF4335 domain-containing protein [Cyanobacterium sp. IPPAS B-1200]